MSEKGNLMRRSVLLILTLSIIVNVGFGEVLKPYILGAGSAESMEVVKEKTRASLDSAGFTILGEYSPAMDESRFVFVITSETIVEAIQSVGGLTGFAAGLRVALTQEDNMINVSYTNPQYLGNAYFQKKYPSVAHLWIDVDKKLAESMNDIGTVRLTPFGSEDGIEAKDLRHYHYMFGMEYFEDVVELNEFSSFSAGKKKIESELVKGGNTELVYSYEIPGKELKVYGIASSGKTGEGHFVPIIDISSPKHTAFLPYEILLNGNEAVMMHGRFRIALSFPDLTMTTFGKIMSTPGDIEDLMKSVTE
jgi:hypothetical protein